MKLRMLLALNVLALLGLLATPAIFLASIFMFDDPESDNALTTILALAMWSFPVTVLVGGIQSIRAYRKRDARLMGRWTLVTYSSAIVIVAGWMVLENVCGGKFSCS